MSALAAELVGIYREARTREDEEYAAEAIDDLLDEVDEGTDEEVLLVLLDLPTTDLTESLLEDVVCMLADTGADAVERLLKLGIGGDDQASMRARDALDRMDDDELADGLFEVLAGGGPEHLRRLAAAALVALGHAGARRLEEAYDDPWTRGLAEAAVADRGDGVRDDRGLGLLSAGDGGSAAVDAGAGADAGVHGAVDASDDDLWVDREPEEAPQDALEAEYRAFLERFERERDG